MASLSRWIDLCNRYDPEDYIPFRVESWSVGFVARTALPALADYPNILHVDARGITLEPGLSTLEQRSQALATITTDLIKHGLIAHWRGEKYPVFKRHALADVMPQADAGGDIIEDMVARPPVTLPDFEAEPLFLIDRGAVQFFGFPAWGIHLNGFVRGNNRPPHAPPGAVTGIWSARRDQNRIMNPGQLDNMVAGGQPWGLSLAANLAKEAQEEANIGPDLIAQAVPASLIAYCVATPEGLSPATMACYDLELPVDFRPDCTDGEIARFHLWSPEETLNLIAQTDEFKPNANLCALDFLLRHDAIPSDHPDYPILRAGLGHPGPF